MVLKLDQNVSHQAMYLKSSYRNNNSKYENIYTINRINMLYYGVFANICALLLREAYGPFCRCSKSD